MDLKDNHPERHHDGTVHPDYQSSTSSTHIYPKLYALFVLTEINSKGPFTIFTSEVTEFYMVLPLFL